MLDEIGSSAADNFRRNRALGLTENICEVVAGLPGLRSAWPKVWIHAGPCHEPYTAISTTWYSRSSLGGAVGPHRPLSPTFLCDSGRSLCFQATPQRAGGGINGATATSAWQATPGAEWLLALTAGAWCVLWPHWHVARRAEPPPRCSFGVL